MNLTDVNDMKRVHNILHKKGQTMWADLQKLYEAVIILRKQIEAIEGADYDGIPLLFGDGFFIEED